MKTLVFKNRLEFSKRDDKTINGVSEEFAKENPTYESMNETNRGCWNCKSCSDCLDCLDCSDCSDCLDCLDCSDCSDCSYCSSCSSCSYCSSCSSCSYCSDCSSCSYCSDCSSCSYCSYCSDCLDCSYCSSCSSCSYCSDCSSCSYCSYCSYCSDCSDCSYCSKKHRQKGEKGDSKLMDIPVIENIHNAVLEAVKGKDNSLEMDSWHTCETTHCRAGWVVHLAGKKGYDLEKLTSTQFAANQIYKASSPIRVSNYRYFETNEKAMENIEECARIENELNAKKP